MAVSSDGGLHFSSPRLCSIPQSAQPVYFIHDETERLQGKRFYGVFNPQPQLAILREIDTCGVFLEQPKEELRLLLEGQDQDRPCYGHYQDYRLQFQAFEEEQQRLLQQYQELEELNAQLREESEGWRERCLAVQAQHKMDIKKREMLRSQSEDIPGDDIQEIS